MSSTSLPLEPPSGMERDVGALFAQLEEVRAETRRAVLDMSIKDLDRRVPGCPHSIGVLLLHIAAVETWWTHQVPSGDLASGGTVPEAGAGDLDSEAASGHGGHHADYYLARLDEVRAETESLCWKLKDAQLEQVSLQREGEPPRTTRWILFHLAEHEAHHRGQALLLKRLGREPSG